jgi:histone H3/H4
VKVMNVPTFERFFRTAADLDVDASDVKRYDDFVNEQIYDLLIIAQAHAKANGRDVIEPQDLPVTKGLQECIHRFRKLDQDIGLEPILEHLAARPQLDLALSEETQAELPEIAGGVSLALACAFPILDPNMRNPQTAQWERAFQLFDLLL